MAKLKMQARLSESQAMIEQLQLKLLSLGDAVNLILLLPHVSITKGLVQLPEEVVLGANLLVVVLLQAIRHVLHVAELAQQAHPLLSLIVSDGLLLVKSRNKSRLGLGHQAGIGIELLQLAEKVGVLSGDPPLAGLEVTQVEVPLLDLLSQLIQSSSQGPLGLFGGSL